MSKKIREHTFYVRGMHCTSCEVLIEKKLLELGNIKSVEASAAKGEVLIEYEGERLTIERLNEVFKREGYTFSDQPGEIINGSKPRELFAAVGIGLLIIVGFIGLNKLGLPGLIDVSSTSSLPMFFGLGLIAGISSCAALVGGLVLSMSKQWLGMYSEKTSTSEKLQPHLMFNAGRIISYAILGGVIGAIGSKLQISLTFTSVLIIAVSIIMFFLALQMLGVKAFRRFQFTVPKFITRRIADETKFQGKQMPFLMGALTFFLPCGFTITAQGLALISGSVIQGALIMLFFALGTLPALLVIGLSAVKFSQNPYRTDRFLRVAGVLVLFFVFYNIHTQLNVLGLPSFDDIRIDFLQNSKTAQEGGLAPIVKGKQILKMNAFTFGYEPSYFKVKVGIPVRWEITDKGTSGCTNAVISRGLFEGEILLTPGQTSVKEFTPRKPGRYKFSCWMGMVSGVIEVVGKGGAAFQNNISSGNGNLFVSSGAESSGGGCGVDGRCWCGRR